MASAAILEPDPPSTLPTWGPDQIVAPGGWKEALDYVIHLHQLLLTMQQSTGWTMTDLASTFAEFPTDLRRFILDDARRAIYSGPLWKLVLAEARASMAHTP